MDALALAERIIAAVPANAPLFNLAAVAARSLGSKDKAEIYWRAAINAQPEFPGTYNDFGMLLKESGRHQEAEAMFRKAIELQPQLAAAHVNLGNLCRATRRPVEAEAAYRRALDLQPLHTDALYNLGLLLAELDRPAEAETAFRQALKIRPEQADVLNDLGMLLASSHREDEAAATFREAVRLKPDFADAHFNSAVLMLESRRHGEALHALRRALDADPRHVNALNCFGNLMKDIGQLDKAEMAFRRALEILPDSANIHNNLGVLLIEAGKLAEAEDQFRQAVALEPDYGHALGQAATCARRRYAWAQAKADGAAIIDAIERGVEGLTPFMVLALPEAGPIHHRQAAVLAGRKQLLSYAQMPPLPTPPRRKTKRLRIGYLSADFHEHATMHLLRGVLANHDRRKLAIHAYSYGPLLENDPFQQQVRDNCDSFVDLQAMSDRAAAERIAADGIDILVDLKGFTWGYRLGISACRPAPVIASWLGYPGSLGDARLADYIVGDPIVTPLDHADQFSETIAQLPDSYQPNDRDRAIGPRPNRQEAGLPEQGVVFCSFNQANKLTAEVFDVWCRLLDQVPGSVLWLLDEGQVAKDNLRQEAGQRGIAPERLIFAPALPHAEHLGRLQLADLALDTYPYTSHTTGSDALWAGVPLVSRLGDAFVSRVAASLLHAVGLPELVVKDWEAYIDLTRRLALDPAALKAVRAKLAANRLTTPLFDTERFTRNLEALYQRMWADHQLGQKTPITLA